MVTAARLEWLLQQMQAGRQCRVRINSHPGQVTVHVVLTMVKDSTMQNLFAIGLVQSMAQNVEMFVTVDHGHRNSAGAAFESPATSHSASLRSCRGFGLQRVQR